MIKNNLLVALRQFRNFYSLLNLIGLVVGFTVFILILTWVNEELSFEHFHKDYSSLYRVVSSIKKEDGGIQLSALTPAPLATKMKSEIGILFRPFAGLVAASLLQQIGRYKFVSNNASEHPRHWKY